MDRLPHMRREGKSGRIPMAAGRGPDYDSCMKLHGSVEDNLNAAVRSARRLRGHPVHADTLSYWDALLHHARRERSAAYKQENHVIGRLIIDLETEIAERSA